MQAVKQSRPAAIVLTLELPFDGGSCPERILLVLLLLDIEILIGDGVALQDAQYSRRPLQIVLRDFFTDFGIAWVIRIAVFSSANALPSI